MNRHPSHTGLFALIVLGACGVLASISRNPYSLNAFASRYSAVPQCPLPIDETVGSNALRWTPWTYRPYCLKITDDKGAPPKLCVYTDANYGPNGLSIITTPDQAASHTYLIEQDLALPPPVRIAEDIPFHITDVPGMGKGLVATRLIKKTEVFLVDHAAVVTDFKPGTSRGQARRQQHQLMRQAVHQLLNEASVTGLSRSSKHASGDELVEDAMLTNSFHTNDMFGASHMSLFPKLARINHACRPNAFLMFSASSFTVLVRAYRNIKPGEEITISYIDIAGTHKERQDDLDHEWGFACQCDLCSSKSKVAASEDRLQQIAELRTQIASRMSAGESFPAAAAAHEVLELLRKERLKQLSPEIYARLVRAYLYAGDQQSAERYGRLGLGIMTEQGLLDDAAPGAPLDLAKLLEKYPFIPNNMGQGNMGPVS